MALFEAATSRQWTYPGIALPQSDHQLTLSGIAKSINTLRWDGSDPAQFSVFLFNPDPQILTSALALSSISKFRIEAKLTPANAYMTSLSISP